MGTEELDREGDMVGWRGGGGEKEEWGEDRGGSTVLGPHGRDSSKTCLRWPRTGPNRTGPRVGGTWPWRRRGAEVGPLPRWQFSPPACLRAERHRGGET